jgi:hypothetical protein
MLQLPIKEQLSQIPAQGKLSSLLAIIVSGNDLAAAKRGCPIGRHLKYVFGITSFARDKQARRKGLFKFANFFASACLPSSDVSWNSMRGLKDNG